MIKFKKHLSKDDFLNMLKLVDDEYLAKAMDSVYSGYTIQETSTFVDSLQNDIPTLLEYQSNVDENITNYKYIKTGSYYKQTAIADTVFDLFDRVEWLFWKRELIEYFAK